MEEKKELYQRENGEWVLFPYLITCTDKNVQEQKYTDDVGYYEVFEELYDDFTINNIQELSYTGDKFLRLSEVQGLKCEDFDEIYDYVMNGNLRPNSKIFTAKVLEQSRADIDYISIMTGVGL